MTENANAAAAAAQATTAVLIGQSTVQIWGMSSAERLTRQLARAGVKDVRVSAEGLENVGSVVILRIDFAYDQRLIDALATRPGATLVAGGVAIASAVAGRDAQAASGVLASGEAPVGTEILDSEGLAGSYNRKLRKREIAFVIPLNSQSVKDVEARSFAGSYKGVTDFVTKYWWPAPAKAVTKWCAVRRITPNQVTYLGLLLMFVALGMFWEGWYLLGLIPAWIMTFLDTVDGKLARVTMTSSKFGDILDHGIDLIHPPFWWIAWIIGLEKAGMPVAHPELLVWIIVGGYVVQRLFEGAFIRLWGFHMHVWRPFDSFFRLITARRNPNLVILTAFTLIGRPDWGMILVCAWIVLSLVVHLFQLVQAAVESRSRTLVSWLDAA
ncbi:CDP-alcohol phosphatidyltransferase family protein [Chenggangzhangella methanolivorans]|uniref:CDP-alcohol phosphatidyltransferase family protein n=1 Tax=Chenggangzhangella methanolivorans TaxID=1437009 RepID=A0A9E6UQS8_9HYPH|nr:CDP-alcohol phosphatidyltransferase family protein [Chenggangzhangella methanolivorans]QZO01415.1 CDP-alcohol phosphatidyltransferase family protein [Chenggangzhangella methanolivorans]